MATVEDQFFEDIAWMKRELLGLKTSHERGLGVFDFAQASSTPPEASLIGYYKLTLVFGDVETFPPIFQLAATVGSFYAPSWDENTKTFTCDVYAVEFLEIPTVTVVSSADIASFEVVKAIS